MVICDCDVNVLRVNVSKIKQFYIFVAKAQKLIWLNFFSHVVECGLKCTVSSICDKFSSRDLFLRWFSMGLYTFGFQNFITTIVTHIYD